MTADAKAKPAKLMWSRADVLVRLGVSRPSLDRWIASGRFPKADAMFGTKAHWKPETVLRWIEAGGTAGKGG